MLIKKLKYKIKPTYFKLFYENLLSRAIQKLKSKHMYVCKFN